MSCSDQNSKPVSAQRRPIYWPLVGHRTTSAGALRGPKPSEPSEGSGDNFDGRRTNVIKHGDIVRDGDSIGVVITQEAWLKHYGTDKDGLGPEEWGNDDWAGVWFPTEDGMLGQHGDLDRASVRHWRAIPESDAIRLLMEEYARQVAAKAAPVNIAVNIYNESEVQR